MNWWVTYRVLGVPYENGPYTLLDALKHKADIEAFEGVTDTLIDSRSQEESQNA